MEQITETQTTQINSPVAAQPQVVTSTGNTMERTAITTHKSSAERINSLVWFFFGVLETLLALRIVLLVLGGRSSGFASFIYNITDPFVVPFRGIFASPAVSGSYFDSAAMLAIIIYALLAWGITALVDAILDK